MIHRSIRLAGWPAVAVATASLMLAGCGQKGPLYLPPQPQAAQPAHNPDQNNKDLQKDNR
ncbi:MAG: lipoprotein [Gammaproteobacteria bacterium]